MGPTTKLLRTQSDGRLVALAQAGHEAAFEAIVERYRRPLLRAGGRVLPESRAEDAVQQAFIAAWRALRRGDEVRELRPWLYRIMQNTALNALRVRGYDHSELEESLRVGEAPQDEIERRDVVRRTLAGLASLPERQREALLRTAVDGRSQAEVAAAMGLTDGAVRQLVHRARHSLRAAATALVPFPAVAWVASASTREPIPERVAELVAAGGAGGAGAMLAKAGTVAVVAGTAVGGGVALEQRDRPAPAKAAETRSGDGARETSRDRAVAVSVSEGDLRPAAAGREGHDGDGGSRGDDEERGGRADERRGSSRRGSGGSGDDDDDDSGSRHGSGERDDDEHESETDDDRSGSDHEDDEVDSSSSGPGSGDDELDDAEEPDEPDEPDSDSSGPGSGDAVEPSSDSSGSDSDEAELDD